MQRKYINQVNTQFGFLEIQFVEAENTGGIQKLKLANSLFTKRHRHDDI